MFLLFFSLYLVIKSTTIIELSEGEPWIPENWISDDQTIFETQHICDDLNGPYLGLIDKNIHKQLSDLGAHNEIQISFDILFTGRWEGSSYFKIYIDSTNIFSESGLSSSTFQTSSTYCKLNTIDAFPTNQKLITVYQTMSHSKRNPFIEIKGSFNCDIMAIGVCQLVSIKNLVIYPTQCHFSCKTCDGPNIDQCLSCPYGSLDSGRCYCQSGLYQYANKCVLSCPKYYIANLDNQCLIQCSLNCQICGNNSCNECEEGYLLHLGKCVKQCPSSSQFNGINKCIDYNEMKQYGSEYLGSYFYSLESNYQEQVNRFEFSQSFTYSLMTQQKYSIYQDKLLLGGYGVWSEGYFSLSYYSVNPHNHLRIYLDVWFIDKWNDDKFQIIVDGTVVYEKNVKNTGTNQFYRTFPDSIEHIALDVIHISNDINIRFVSNLMRSPLEGSIGITNIHILIDYCDFHCIWCINTQCSLCEPGYQLVNNKCAKCDNTYNRKSDCNCLEGYYEDNKAECLKCKAECQNCLNVDTCIECKTGSHLISLPLCQSCENGYYYDDAMCLNCQYNCKTCSTFNVCIQCADGFVNPPQCQCQDGYFETETHQCYKCSQQCKTCTSYGDYCTSCSGNRISLPDCSCPKNSLEIENSIWCTTCTIASLNISLNYDLTILIINFIWNIKDLYLNCNHIFKSQTIELFGENPLCFKDNNKIQVKLGPKANLKQGDLIEFYPNIIQFEKCSTVIQTYYNNELRILGQADSVKDKLQFVQSKIYLSRCQKQNLLISFLNQNNFQLQQWNLIQYKKQDPQLDNFMQFLNQQIQSNPFTQYFEFKGNILDDENEIIIELQYVSILNEIYKSQLIVIQEFGKITTEITYQQTPYQISQEILISIYSQYCPHQIFQNYDRVNYLIQIDGQLYQQDNQIGQYYIFTLKSQSLKIGIYNLNIKTLFQDKLINEQIINLQIIDNIQRLVLKSTSTTFNYRQSINLEAYVTNSQLGNQQFIWECFDVLENELCIRNNQTLKLGNKGTITIPANTFSPFQTIIISVSYKNMKEQIQLQIVETDVPKVDFETTPDIYSGFINFYDQINIKLRFVDMNVNPDTLQYIGLLYTSERIIAQFTFDYLELKLQIWDFLKLEELSEKLTLKITIHNPNYFQPSIIFMNIYINLPPQSCVVNIEPTSGQSLITDFTISTKNCFDVNQSLQYRILLYQNQSDLHYDYAIGQLYKGVVLNPYQYDPVYKTKLVGKGETYLVVQVKDTLNGISNYTLVVNVTSTETEQVQSMMMSSQSDLKSSILFMLNSENNNQSSPQQLTDKTFQNTLQQSECDCEYDVNQQLFLKKLLVQQSQSISYDQINKELDKSKVRLNEIEQQLKQQITLIDNSYDRSKQLLQNVFLHEEVLGYAQYIAELFNKNQISNQFRRQLQEYQNSIKINNQQIIDSLNVITKIQLSQQMINSKKLSIQTNQFNISTQRVTSKLLQQALGNVLTSQQQLVDDDETDYQQQQNSIRFEYKLIKYASNPYLYDSDFMEINKNHTNTILYHPTVSFEENQTQLIDSMSTLNYEFPKSDKQKFYECVMKIEDSWSLDACTTTEKDFKTICECQKISIITLIDAMHQLADQLTSFFSIDTINKINQCHYEEMLFLYILILFTLIFIVFLYIGHRLDQKQINSGSFFSAKVMPQSWDEFPDKERAGSIDELAQLDLQQQGKQKMKQNNNHTKNNSIKIQNNKTLSEDNQNRQIDSACSSKRSMALDSNGRSGKAIEETEGNQLSGTPILDEQKEQNSPKREDSIFNSIQNQQVKFHQGFFLYFKINHVLMSLYYLYNEQQSRVYRTIIVYMSIIGEICILTFFGEIISLNTILALSILQSLFGLIFCKIFSFLIHNTVKFLKIIGLTLILLVVSFFYFILLGSLARYNTIKESQYWALAYLTSFVLNYIIYSLLVQFTMFTFLNKFHSYERVKKIMKYILEDKVYQELYGKQ
ncbi:unnamed protein product [Paramecium primaurelia]|uniref:PKD/REJ-like domain-containing protein n=1 Tax=Paramecium primaurelia TaxID=5886 RepID=A0A8S1NVC8_PARPR|nr:unnamed protein product [Paramecium primaurelia]